MPKTRIDYSKTVIYKMVCDDINIKDIYVGHTTSFTKRKAEHKAKYCQEKSKEYSKLLYQFMRQHGGWDKFTMVEIEKYPCTDGNEARARERYWFEILQPSLNRYRPSITKEEKKERNARTNKAYYERNKERILALNKEYKRKVKLTKKESNYTLT